jgi:hypothetical protein
MYTDLDVRMLAEERRQMALLRQALSPILQMFTWNEEQGHWTVYPNWQGGIDETMELRRRMGSTGWLAGRALTCVNTTIDECACGGRTSWPLANPAIVPLSCVPRMPNL